MAEKTSAELVAEHEAEIAKLKAKQAAEDIKAAPQYPKHIRIPCKEHDPAALKDADGKFYQIVEVVSEEDEKNRTKKEPLPAASVTAQPTDEEKAKQKEKERAEEASTRASRAGKR